MGGTLNTSHTPTEIDIAALVADLTTKSAMINMGEKIAWGSETALMDQAAAALIAQDAELRRLREALAEAKETLVEVKREMWRNASGHWTLSDFLNWAIVQRITAAISAARADATEAAAKGGA